MNIQYVILGFLFEEELSGYDIKRKMEISVSHFFDASFGAIYPALRKMEKEESVVKKIVSQDGKPNKNVFEITDKGRREFEEYMMSPINPTTIRSDFMIRLFFGKLTSKERILQWMKEEREKSQVEIDELNTLKQQFNMNRYKRITLEYGLETAKLNIAFFEKEIAIIEKEISGGEE
ncbi:PadR family transcriptional regulator [Niallia sp. 01092]|uniref:PadR family transcriptional regulator n=1 Tax=unclassified Niallia TaxID=2837522 RepID=UPI003FCF768F